MHTAIAITLLFVAGTSLLGANRSINLGHATGQKQYAFGAIVAIAMGAWLAFCAIWMLQHL